MYRLDLSAVKDQGRYLLLEEQLLACRPFSTLREAMEFISVCATALCRNGETVYVFRRGSRFSCHHLAVSRGRIIWRRGLKE